jgi:NADH-quinone oxidoreductase subunit K
MLGALLFAIGLLTTIVQRHRLVVLFGVELMLQAVTLALAALGTWFQDWSGEVAMLVVLTVAAVQFTVGLGAALFYVQGQQPSARSSHQQDERC